MLPGVVQVKLLVEAQSAGDWPVGAPRLGGLRKKGVQVKLLSDV